MDEEKVKLLLQYLDTLKALNSDAYFCQSEIAKVITAIEVEFNL